MWTVNRILTAVFDAIYVPLGVLPRWASLTLISCAIGALALVVVKYCSNQKAIARVKDDIKANMLAIKLFKDDLGVMFRAQRGLIWAALRMQYHMLLPLLVMLAPIVLAAAQMGLRYQWRPFAVGDHFQVTARVADPSDWANLDLDIRRHSGFEVLDRVRAPTDASVTWRLRAKSEGKHTLDIVKGGLVVSKELAIGDRVDRVCPMRPNRGFLDQLLYPAEAPFAKGAPVQSITVAYPLRDSWYAGAGWWIVWFLVVSMLFALALKPVLKVKL